MNWKRAIEIVIFLFAVLALVYLVTPAAQRDKDSIISSLLASIGIDQKPGSPAAPAGPLAEVPLATPVIPSETKAAPAPTASVAPTVPAPAIAAGTTAAAGSSPSANIVAQAAPPAASKPAARPGPSPAPGPNLVPPRPSKAEVQGVSCLVLGTAGVGAMLAAGPSQFAAAVAGGPLGGPSPVLVAGVVGAAFAAGCALGAVTVPALIWAMNGTESLKTDVANVFDGISQGIANTLWGRSGTDLAAGAPADYRL